MFTIPPRQQLSNCTRLAIRTRNVIRLGGRRNLLALFYVFCSPFDGFFSNFTPFHTKRKADTPTYRKEREMLLRKSSLAKMRALTSLECRTSCSRNGAQSSSILFALASFTSSSSCCCCSTNHHRRVLKFLPENVTFRKGMFTAPSSVRFAAKASSSAGNNNNCDDSSKREVQFDYSENTDPVVNENFIAPNFGYKRQYKGEIICIFGWSRECLRRRHTFTHLSSPLFFTRRYQKQLVAIYSTRANR